MEILVKRGRTNKKKILVLIHPWSTVKNLFYLVKKNLPNEYGYLEYYYSKDILNSSPITSSNNCKKLINKIVSDLNKLNQKKEKEVYIYSESLGSAFAPVIAERIKVKKIVMIVTGDNLAECFWKGKETRYLRNQMQNKGVTLGILKEVWKDISPDYAFQTLSKEAKYYIKLVKEDATIPFIHGLKLIKILKKFGISYLLKIDHIPHPRHKNAMLHRLEVIKESLFPEETLKFLTGK